MCCTSTGAPTCSAGRRRRRPSCPLRGEVARAVEPTISDRPRTTGSGTGGSRIQSVARACQLLLWLAGKAEGATAKEIALAHRLTLPTTYHLLNTLVDQGLLPKDEERRSRLDDGATLGA